MSYTQIFIGLGCAVVFGGMLGFYSRSYPHQTFITEQIVTTENSTEFKGNTIQVSVQPSSNRSVSGSNSSDQNLISEMLSFADTEDLISPSFVDGNGELYQDELSLFGLGEMLEPLRQLLSKFLLQQRKDDSEMFQTIRREGNSVLVFLPNHKNSFEGFRAELQQILGEESKVNLFLKGATGFLSTTGEMGRLSRVMKITAAAGEFRVSVRPSHHNKWNGSRTLDQIWSDCDSLLETSTTFTDIPKEYAHILATK